jgi:isocitrate dehydrogenase
MRGWPLNFSTRNTILTAYDVAGRQDGGERGGARHRDASLPAAPAGRQTSTNPIASIFAWTLGLIYRGRFDGTPEVTKFAEALEKVCIGTVESGFMTRDLAVLIGPDQKWLNTQDFQAKLDENLKLAMG